jgi:uncharacterized protein
MTAPAQPAALDSEPTPPPKRAWLRDDIAYILPMAAFLTFTWAGGNWKSFYPISYVAKVIITAILLVICWRHYTKISWRYWWLGVIVGVIGIVQWVPMQLWLQDHVAFFAPRHTCVTHPDISQKGPGQCPICKAELVPDVFNPFAPGKFPSPTIAWAFVAVRIIGAVLVVPVMEELFWRDFLWRQIIAPNDFKLARVGEFEWTAFLIIPLVFAAVHGNWWLTSIVWALMIGALLVYTKSLGACIIAHATTNLLLAAYVLKWKDWAFW